jgi:hypothetical protein
MNFQNFRLVGFLFGLPILFVGIVAIYNGSKAVHWPSTMGIVKVSNKIGGWGFKTLDLKVTYEVEQVQFICSRIEFGRGPDWRDRYRYAIDSNVRVFFDSQDPNKCALEPGISLAMIIELIVGLVLTFLGLYSHKKVLVHSPDLPATGSLDTARKAMTVNDAHRLAEAGDLIEAIKVYRLVTGMGLKESKDYIQNYLKNRGSGH